MKKLNRLSYVVLILVPLLLIIFLICCSFQNVTRESLTGIWRQTDHEELWDQKEPVYELYFTDDGFMYLLYSSDVTDIGWHTETFLYQYSVKNNRLSWSEPEPDPNAYYYDNVKIKLRNDGIVLSLRYGNYKKTVDLIKVPDAIPFGYTQADKEIIAAEETAIRDKIITFSEELSEKTSLPLILREDSTLAGQITQGVQFVSGDTLVCISRDKRLSKR